MSSACAGPIEMKRRWNIPIWLGLLVVLGGAVTYFPLVDRFPAQGNLPWATLLIFGVGLLLIAGGLVYAFREPRTYRGRIAGSFAMVLGLAVVGMFLFGTFYFVRQLPPSSGAPRIGQKAPDFTLPDKEGRQVSLSELLSAGNPDHPNGVVLIFYRGYW